MTGNVCVMLPLPCRARSRHKGGVQSRGSRPKVDHLVLKLLSQTTFTKGMLFHVSDNRKDRLLTEKRIILTVGERCLLAKERAIIVCLSARGR